MSRSLTVIAGLVLGWFFPVSAEAQRVVTFGVVVDGPSFYRASFRPLLQNEIRDLLGSELPLRDRRSIHAASVDAGLFGVGHGQIPIGAVVVERR